MNEPRLLIKDLQVAVDSKEVIKNLSAEIFESEIVVLMGANGSGKSSLASVLMGNPNYEVVTGEITFEGKKILPLKIDERARLGIFVGWQNPVTIPGVSVFNLCKSSYEAAGYKILKLTEFKLKLVELGKRVGLSSEHISRSMNEGFSGGEKKRLELLQLLLLQPKLAILDEIDSGLDMSGVKMMIEVVNELKKAGSSIVLITHNKRMLQEVEADRKWEMKNGRLSIGI